MRGGWERKRAREGMRRGDTSDGHVSKQEIKQASRLAICKQAGKQFASKLICNYGQYFYR